MEIDEERIKVSGWKTVREEGCLGVTSVPTGPWVNC